MGRLGGVEVGEAVDRIYCMREEIKSKISQNHLLPLTQFHSVLSIFQVTKFHRICFHKKIPLSLTFTNMERE